MEVSKEYISKLLGIIEEQKRINSDLVRIIQKQDLEIKQLKKESEKYRIAYESLLIEVKELRIKVLEIDNLKAENKALKAENRKLKLEIKKLKEELGKDSHNSSKPPSSNKFGNRHRNRNKKPKNKKKVGGQTGHKGNNLKKEAQADKKVIHVANKCSKCGYDLSKVKIKMIIEEYRQEIDILAKRLVKNHHLGIKECPNCGIELSGNYPKYLSKSVQYGNNLKAFSSYLSSYQLIPYNRLKILLNDLFSINISIGTLYNINKEMAGKSEYLLENIKKILQESKLMHADETGLYCKGKLHYAYVFSNNNLSYFDINKSRSKKALDEIGILTNYRGELVTDFYAMYRMFPNLTNYFCNAHLLRELTFIYEMDNKYWSKSLIDILVKLNNLDKKEANYKYKKENYLKQFDNIIENNLEIETRLQENNKKTKDKKSRGKVAQTKSKNILDRLKKYRKAYLGFVLNDNIPFTNNQAERDFRFIKVQQKISGTFRSIEGAKNFLKTSSIVSTIRKQNLNVLDSLNDILLQKTISLEPG